MTDLEQATRAVLRELDRYAGIGDAWENTDGSRSEPEAILPRDDLHSAVVALEGLCDGTLSGAAAMAWRLLVAASRSENPDRLEAILTHAEAMREALTTASVVYMGNGVLMIDGESKRLTDTEGYVVEALCRKGACTKGELEKQSGVTEAVRVLRNLCGKHPKLADSIRFPGGKGRGGYSTTIACEDA